MIHKLLKSELDQLKDLVAPEIYANWKLSYADVIKHLINEYKKSRCIVYPLEPTLLFGSSLKKSGVKVSIPLTNSALNVRTKLQSKKVISYFIED